MRFFWKWWFVAHLCLIAACSFLRVMEWICKTLGQTAVSIPFPGIDATAEEYWHTYSAEMLMSEVLLVAMISLIALSQKSSKAG